MSLNAPSQLAVQAIYDVVSVTHQVHSSVVVSDTVGGGGTTFTCDDPSGAVSTTGLYVAGTDWPFLTLHAAITVGIDTNDANDPLQLLEQFHYSPLLQPYDFIGELDPREHAPGQYQILSHIMTASRTFGCLARSTITLADFLGTSIIQDVQIEDAYTFSYDVDVARYYRTVAPDGSVGAAFDPATGTAAPALTGTAQLEQPDRSRFWRTFFAPQMVPVA